MNSRKLIFFYIPQIYLNNSFKFLIKIFKYLVRNIKTEFYYIILS